MEPDGSLPFSQESTTGSIFNSMSLTNSRDFLYLMGPDGSLPFSQESTTGSIYSIYGSVYSQA
jgi:hypothetical protein